MFLENKIILITGGNAGIGEEMTKQLSALGATIIICGRNEASLKQVAEQYNVDLMQCDVTNANDQMRLVNLIEEKYGVLDMLINNAGVMKKYAFIDDTNTLANIEQEITINAMSPLTTTFRCLPLLKQSDDASVVFVSSGLAYVPFPSTPVYTGTKSLIHHCAQTLRHQFKAQNIKVFELLPPATQTTMADNFASPKVKLMPVDKMVEEFIRGLKNERYEIAAGASKQMRLISRIAPNFLIKQLVKAFP